MPPENRRPPAGTGGHSENDLLTGGIEIDHNADSHAVVAAAWSQLTGLVLSAPSLPLARELLDGLPTAPDPIVDWWISGVRLSVDAGSIPTPITAGHAALTAGIEVPPGMRGLVFTSGWALVSDVTGIAMQCGRDMVRIIKSGAVRSAFEVIGERLISSAWRGDDDQLAEFVNGQAAELGLLAKSVVSNG